MIAVLQLILSRPKKCHPKNVYKCLRDLFSFNSLSSWRSFGIKSNIQCPALIYPYPPCMSLLSANQRQTETALPILCSVLEGHSQDLLQFILDASVHPEINTLRQTSADETLRVVFHLTRTWCFALHKERVKVLGRWS